MTQEQGATKLMHDNEFTNYYILKQNISVAGTVFTRIAFRGFHLG